VTIELQPDEQRIINDAVRSGEYAKPEDVISDALSAWQKQRTSVGSRGEYVSRAKDLVELFAPLHGLDLDLSRNPSPGRSVDL
jgi:hypothetical protein